MPQVSATHVITSESAGTVLAAIRRHLPGTSWSAARALLAQHRIAVNGILCVDEARRLVAGDRLEVRSRALPPPPTDRDVAILYLDEHLVVAHKPSGMLTVRHPGDVNWSPEKKLRQPALEESLERLISQRERAHRGHRKNAPPAHSAAQTRAPADAHSAKLFTVHRIDRETSGIVLFARTEVAQNLLIRQFAAHTIHRRYLCVIPGFLAAQTLRSVQIRDRGDGLRGSTEDIEVDGRTMVTHIRPLREFAAFTELECRLETGRTNQIRIQLAELSHPLCGDVKYRGPHTAPEIPDHSHAPRLALHAAELGIAHPMSNAPLRWTSHWPPDILRWLAGLKSSPTLSR